MGQSKKTQKSVQYISQDGYDALTDKLAEFDSEYISLCKEIARGDTLKDVDTYNLQEKRMRLEFLQNEIVELNDKLSRARIIEKAPELTSTQKIHLGSKVHLKSGNQELKYTLVSSLEADPLSGKISDQSPLGSALLGKMVNALVKVTTPRREVSYKIVRIDSI